MAANPSDRPHRHVFRLFNFGAVGMLSDAQLMDRFITQRDDAADAAFEELVVRHGPIVLRVCQSVLHDAHAAEDAFQAVFLILANRAGSLRRHASVACWLFGVAHRVATRARRSAARRHSLEQRAAQRSPESYLQDQYDPDCEILREEIHGLPERLCAPIVLCYLQGLTCDAVALELGLSPAAIRGRLARARQHLRQRLTRRGVTAPAAVLVAGAAGQAQAAVPSALAQSTTRIALGFVTDKTAAVLAQGVLNSMLFAKLRTAAVLLCISLGGSYCAWHAGAAAVQKKPKPHPGDSVPTVKLIHPPVQNVVREVGQPCFIESFERIPIYPTVTGYIENMKVDIGTKVKKGDVLCTLLPPALALDHATRTAPATPASERIGPAGITVEAADARVKAARARLDQAQASLTTDETGLSRWKSELEQLERVVDPKRFLDSIKRLKADAPAQAAARVAIDECAAATDVARAAIHKAEGELLAYRATLARSRVDVAVAAAALAVAESEQKRISAWASCFTITAPCDGLIVARKAATGEFVHPKSGVPPAVIGVPRTSPRTTAPVYIIDRIDTVRVFAEIREHDANDVHIGTKATVLVKAYRDEPIPASITRTSWTQTVKPRALRVEIDLPNLDGKLKPGMYAYAKLILD